MKIDAMFLHISETVVWLAGHRFVLAAAVGLVIVWCGIGWTVGLPKQWYLISNMFGTLAVLFVLLVIQHSQNRDMHALQVKMDELIRSSNAGNHMIGAERLEAEELAKLADDQA